MTDVMSRASSKEEQKRQFQQSTELLSAWDKRWIWHPFTQMADWEREEMLVIESAKGSWLKDTNGRRYLDGVSSLWCNVHGHRVKAIDRAVRKQLSRVAHSTFLGLSNVPAIKLAKKLTQIAPQGLTRVFYSDSGSEAVEIALKMSYQYWQQSGETQRCKFIRFENAYHGDTLGSVSVGGIDLFHKIYRPLLFETCAAPAPDRYRDSFEGGEDAYAEFYAKKLAAVVEEYHHETCALIMEPMIQGAAGMIKQPRGYMARVRAITKRYGLHLIFDEVATGFGRTGRMFASEHEHVNPDLMCVAKGLTGGYLPLAATLATEDIYNAFRGPYEAFKTFFHGHTYTANPLAASAALASLSLFEEEKTLDRLQARIELLTAKLLRFRELPYVGDVRQAGFMVGIELVRDRATKAPFEAREKIGIRVTEEARRRGVIIRPLGNVIVLMPPLSIKRAEIVKLTNVVYKSIRTVTEGK